jgi:hypothetical protein
MQEYVFETEQYHEHDNPNPSYYVKYLVSDQEAIEVAKQDVAVVYVWTRDTTELGEVQNPRGVCHPACIGCICCEPKLA